MALVEKLREYELPLAGSYADVPLPAREGEGEQEA